MKAYSAALVEQAERCENLVALDGVPQLTDQRQAAAARLVVFERVEGVAAAGALGHVHGDVGAPQ